MEIDSGKESSTSYRKFDAKKRVVVDQSFLERTGETRYVVKGCLSFYVGKRGKEYWVHVPNGYKFTGAVVPKRLQGLIEPTGVFGKAAVIHHYLCEVRKVRIMKERFVVDRLEANRVFLEAMKVAGVGFIRRWVLFASSFLMRGEVKSFEEATEAFTQ